MTWTVRHAGLTDRGRQRSANEDRWCAIAEKGLYLVADGVGGVAGGGLAAEIVAETLPPLVLWRLADEPDVTTSSAKNKLSRGLVDLSRRLRCESQGQLGMDGMGSTVVLAVVRPPAALIAHMGNSRAYLIRGRNVTQLTEDHSLVNLLVAAGEITAPEAEVHPSRGQVTRYVGMPSEPLPEVGVLSVQSGDRLLLCSDGLTDAISDDQLRRLLIHPDGDLRTDCRRLVDTANAAGGRDNVAVVLITIHRQDGGCAQSGRSQRP